MTEDLEDGGLFEVSNLPVPVKPKAAKKTASAVSPGLQDAFDAFWGVYPKRQGKKAALSAFVKQCVKEGESPLHIVQAAAAYRDRCREIGKDVQFIPYPATWLNQGRFDDDPEEAPTTRSRTDDVFRQNMESLARDCAAEGIDPRDIGKPEPPRAFNPDIW